MVYGHNRSCKRRGPWTICRKYLMKYSDITFNDPNKLKRYLQQRRLEVALECGSAMKPNPETICDYGAGNGELCKYIKQTWERVRVVAFEPAGELADQAVDNVSGLKSVEVVTSTRGVGNKSVDLLFCLEVFEHLPEAETAAALADIKRMLKPDGVLVIGVPVEIGLPALYKGLFRSLRRPGQYDTRFTNIVRCVFRTPPKDRPLGEIANGFRYHFEHVGFDYRVLKTVLSAHFKSVTTSYSPFGWTFGLFMPEVYFTVSGQMQPNI